MRQATASFNAVTAQGWETGQRNGTRLHHATYKYLRASYPNLPSQLHCAARVRAAEALKSTDERRKQGRKVSCPTSSLCPARYDARSYWVKLQEGIASLATIGARVVVAFNAEAAGVPLVLVDPRDTSRTCSRCGYCDKGNRKSQDKFLCLKCGFALNADLNAAINVGARAECSDGLLCRSKGSPNDQAQAPLPLGGGI